MAQVYTPKKNNDIASILPVVGGVVGAIYGGPAGASAGASAGQKVGEIGTKAGGQDGAVPQSQAPSKGQSVIDRRMDYLNSTQTDPKPEETPAEKQAREEDERQRSLKPARGAQ